MYCKVPISDPLFERARVFVERRQNFDGRPADDADGGFFFSTTEFDINKAGRDGEHFRSYGTATADGILALLAIGRPLRDEHVVAAERWLISHHRNIEVPGFVGDVYHRWPRGLAFYYASTSAQAFRAFQVNAGNNVTDILKQTQRDAPARSWRTRVTDKLYFVGPAEALSRVVPDADWRLIL
jgi:hypothetical protein